jgi:ribose transport system substrate-binding protein
LQAVKGAGKVGKIQIVCFDDDDDTLAGIQAGEIFSTIIQQPYQFGYQSLTLMAKYRGGDKTMVPANKVIIVPTLVVQKDNVADIWANLKKEKGQ